MKILLTGATGLIGGELAVGLSEAGHEVSAVVRARTPSEAAERMEARLARSETRHPERRSVAYVGDLGLPMLGLSDAVLDRLRGCLDVVIHAAADTSFAPGARNHVVNVEGTKHVLRLIQHLGGRTHLMHVSSAAVCSGPPDRNLRESDELQGPLNDYVASKRAAESAVACSGLPYTILRPTIVLSDGVRSRAFARSILWAVPVAMTAGMFPGREQDRIDFVPVSYVRSAVVALVPRLDALPHRIYHVSSGPEGATTLGELARRGARGSGGSKIVFLDGARWRAALRANTRSRRLVRALEHYRPFATANVTYDTTRLRAALGADAPECPRFSEYAEEVFAQLTRGECLEEVARP